MNHCTKLLLALITVTLTACGGGGGGGGSSSGAAAECSALHAKIYGGDLCNQTAQTPVVALIPVATDGTHLALAGICTGALVTVDDFVTSAHCFVEPARSLGNQLAGFIVVAGGDDGEVFEVRNLSIHPLYNGKDGSPFDIAMGTLDRIPSPPIGPLPIITTPLTLPGDTVTAFGYGTSNTGEVGRLKAATIKIEAIAAGNLVGLLQTSNASICPGDSGGPLVRVVNGVTGLVGINSFVTNTCAGQASPISGFVDMQFPTITEFVLGYAGDVAVR